MDGGIKCPGAQCLAVISHDNTTWGGFLERVPWVVVTTGDNIWCPLFELSYSAGSMHFAGDLLMEEEYPAWRDGSVVIALAALLGHLCLVPSTYMWPHNHLSLQF